MESHNERLEKLRLRAELAKARSEMQEIKDFRIKKNMVAVSSREMELGAVIHTIANKLTAMIKV